MAECDAITCDIAALSLDEIVAMLTQEDTNGDPALNTVEVEGTGEPFVTCDNMNTVNYEVLIRKMLTFDANGNLALKIIKSTAA